MRKIILVAIRFIGMAGLLAGCGEYYPYEEPTGYYAPGPYYGGYYGPGYYYGPRRYGHEEHERHEHEEHEEREHH